jgi:hypothetical protein
VAYSVDQVLSHTLSMGGNQSGIFLDQILVQYLRAVVRFAFSVELVLVHYPEVLDKVEYSVDQVLVLYQGVVVRVGYSED